MRLILLRTENSSENLMNEIDIPVAPAKIANHF